MSLDEVLLFFLMMMSGWLPPCHEGAADCRPDRFLLSVSSCTSSLAHLHASSLLRLFFSIEIKKGFQSHVHFGTFEMINVSTLMITRICSFLFFFYSLLLNQYQCNSARVFDGGRTLMDHAGRCSALWTFQTHFWSDKKSIAAITDQTHANNLGENVVFRHCPRRQSQEPGLGSNCSSPAPTDLVEIQRAD